ncbi:MAG TPA: LapA family protein [Acidimicrobiia bacterium]
MIDSAFPNDKGEIAMDDGPVRDVGDMMEPEARSGVSPGVVIALIAIALVVIFVLQNMDSTNITVLWWDAETPLWLLALVIFALGFLAGYLVKTRRVRRKRKEAEARVG